MKRIDECTDMTVLVALLVVGILLVMGAYRIFSYLCENAALDARTFLLGAACLLLAVVGFLLGYFLTEGLMSEGWRYAAAVIAAAVFFLPSVFYDRQTKKDGSLTYTILRLF